MPSAPSEPPRSNWQRRRGDAEEQGRGGKTEDKVSPICWETVCLSSMIKENQKLVHTCCGARNCPCTGTCGQGRLWRCPPLSWSTATLSPGWTSGCLPTLQREEMEREQICWKWMKRERGGRSREAKTNRGRQEGEKGGKMHQYIKSSALLRVSLFLDSNFNVTEHHNLLQEGDLSSSGVYRDSCLNQRWWEKPHARGSRSSRIMLRTTGSFIWLFPYLPRCIQHFVTQFLKRAIHIYIHTRVNIFIIVIAYTWHTGILTVTFKH